MVIIVMTQLMICQFLLCLHHFQNWAHYKKVQQAIENDGREEQKKFKMKILEEIKKQVEQEMIKIKKNIPAKPRVQLTQTQKKALITMINQGMALKDAAKQLQVSYHEAKISYNEYRRKNSGSQSETQSQGEAEIVRTAGISNLRKPPQHFVIHSIVDNTVTSVRKLYNVIVLQPNLTI